MQHRSNMLKVLSPIEGRNGKTIWLRVGSAFINRDGSTNVYLDAYPISGKLQIRPFDDHVSARDADSGVAGDVASGMASAMPLERGPEGLPF